MSKELAKRNGLHDIALPCEVSVPKSIDDAASLLDRVGGLLGAGHWGTAAIVWAYTEPDSGRRTDLNLGKKFPRLTIDEFAKLGIRGLSSRPSVRKYRNRWQEAIDEGLRQLSHYPGSR